jgi:hypothetical protein
VARVFISHSSANSDSAKELADWLRKEGFPEPFLDVEGLLVGQDWERRLYEEISGCDALLILVTSHWLDSKWCFAEFTQARAFGKPILPLICEAIDDKSLALFVPQIQRLPLWSDRKAAFDQLRQALQEITLESGGGDWPPRGDPHRSPFPGLQPFQEDDAAVFCGREVEIRAVLEHLHARRVQWGQALLLLHGAAGAGKSSLLRAGVIPRLKRLRRQWIVLPTIRFHPDPCEALALALAVALTDRGDKRDWRAILQDLEEGERRQTLLQVWRQLALDLQLAQGAADARILIPIDQGEELWSGIAPARVASCCRWLAAALASDQPFQVLMAIRSDCLDRLRDQADLGSLMASYLLPRLSLSSVHEIINRPATVAGIRIDPELVAQATNDTEEEEALPLLACVLRDLYERHAQEQQITLQDYQNMGDSAAGVTPLARVVSRMADEALALPHQSDPAAGEQLRDLRHACLQLVRFDDNRLIRRPALLAHLPPGAHDLLRRLAAAHLIAIDEDSGRVEVTHDALLEHWHLLHRWLQEARDFLITRTLLEEDLRLWQETPAERKGSALLYGLKLEKARGWLAQVEADFGPAPAGDNSDQDLKAFVEASDQETRRLEQRQQLIRRSLLLTGWGFSALLLAASASTGWLLRRAQAAETSSYFSVQEAQVDADPLKSVIYGLAVLRRQGFKGGLSLQVASLLQEALQRPLAVTPLVPAHQEGIISFAILSDQEWISGGADGRVRHWRRSNLLSSTESGARGPVNALLSLANGDWISASADGSLIRWREGQPVARLRRPEPGAGAVVSLLALPGGDWVSGSDRGELVLWRGDRPQRVLAARHQGGDHSRGNGRIWSLAAGRDGRWASGDSNGLLQLWEQDGRLRASVPTRQGQVFALVIRADGTLVSGGADGTLLALDPDGRARGSRRSLDGASVWGLAELANGDLLSAGRYGVLQRWRDGDPEGRPMQTGHRGQWSIVASADRRTVVTYGQTERDDRFQAWRLVAGTEKSSFVPGGGLWTVAVGNQRGDLVSGWRDGGLREGLAGPLRGALRGEGLWKLERLGNDDLLSIGTEGGLRRWPAASLMGGSAGQAAWGKPIEHGAGPLLTVREHQGGWLLGDRRGRLWYWPGGRPSERPLLTGGSPLFSLLSLGDGWVSGWGDGQLRIWQRGQLRTEDSGQPQVLSLAGLPGGEWLSGGSDGSLQRWRGGQRAGSPFTSGQTTVWGLLPLPNGDLLSIGEEGMHSTVRLVSPQWVAGLACRELEASPSLQERRGPAGEAGKLCAQLKREMQHHGGQKGNSPLERYLQRATGHGGAQPETIRLKDGRRLRWIPRPLNRLSTSSLEARFQVDGEPRQAVLNCRLGYWQTLPGGVTSRPDSRGMRELFAKICSQLERLPASRISSLRGQALLFDPPSQVRTGPNGAQLCLLDQPREISVLGIKDLWLATDACGTDRPGFIHRSLVRF